MAVFNAGIQPGFCSKDNIRFCTIYQVVQLVLIGWKLTFSIRNVFCSFELRFLEVSGVDECTGFRFLDGTGL